MSQLPTDFASAERTPQDELMCQAEYFGDTVTQHLLNAVTNIVLVVNENRQIVFANNRLLELLHLENYLSLIGLRPGELFFCENADKSLGGCGTTKWCQHCGAVKSILNALSADSFGQHVEECRIVKRQGSLLEAFDLKVCATPFDLYDKRYVIFAISDISHEKRRRALERIFFHDLLNTAGGMRNLLELLNEEAPDGLKPETELLHDSFIELVEEIRWQKELLSAEDNLLAVNPITLNTLELLQGVVRRWSKHDVAVNRHIELTPGCKELSIRTDFTLLRRILGNMIKNALEAVAPKETVTVSCQQGNETISFSVHNPGVIPEDIQLQLFQRSFSTKGAGRGLGTYSIRLLSERYLKGTVAFTSTEEEGTTFTVTLPQTLEHPEDS